jgi:SnoaL-like domain
VSATDAVGDVLDAFHAGAAAADEERYAATLAPEMVFIGTAPGERWQGTPFREFVHSSFSDGKGWTYVPSERSIRLSEDGRTAWFDERVDNDWYGECRGSGVLQLYGDAWKIEQYNLTIPIPDEVAKEVVATIRALPS